MLSLNIDVPQCHNWRTVAPIVPSVAQCLSTSEEVTRAMTHISRH